MRLTFSPKVPCVVEALLCRPLASVMMVGARERWERGDDVCKRHIPEARRTCRGERKLVSVL
jgi:hypothetical protein